MGCCCSEPRSKLDKVALPPQPTKTRRRRRQSESKEDLKVFHRLSVPFASRIRKQEVLSEGKDKRILAAKYVDSAVPCRVCIINKVKGQVERLSVTMEARRLSRLDHPHTLHLLEALEDESAYYLVQQNGTCTLDEVWTHPALLQEGVLCIIAFQVLSALAYLRSLGITCNLNARHIVLAGQLKEGLVSVKLTGFGQFDTVAPEVCAHNFKCPDSTVSEKSALWSLAALLYAQLCRKHSVAVVVTPTADDAALFRSVAPAMSEFLELLLEHTQRPSALQALQHPWIQGNFNAAFWSKVRPLLRQAQAFRPTNALREAILRLILLIQEQNKECLMLGQAFAFADPGTGQLGLEEMSRLYSQFLTKKEARLVATQLMTNLDVDKNGYVSYLEFLTASCVTTSLFTQANVLWAFRFFDEDESGTVSLQEFMRVLPGQWNTLVANADRNGDGVVDFREFKYLLVAAQQEL